MASHLDLIRGVHQIYLEITETYLASKTSRLVHRMNDMAAGEACSCLDIDLLQTDVAALLHKLQDWQDMVEILECSGSDISSSEPLHRLKRVHHDDPLVTPEPEDCLTPYPDLATCLTSPVCVGTCHATKETQTEPDPQVD